MEPKRPNEFIHSSSHAIEVVGKASIVIGCVFLLAGIIWLLISTGWRYEGAPWEVPFVISCVGLSDIIIGVFIKGSSVVVRASETFLYDRNDHPAGTKDTIETEAKRQHQEAMAWARTKEEEWNALNRLNEVIDNTPPKE